ncbi:glycosyltransferase family 2 protein [Rhizobium sp. Root1220]|uniref:glycosyltransferase family 2 protein n=1 Tax=Rhizobium sp. Root1220 TaxID=1736432 RepID=UPI0006F5B3FE|nr:glycosyltransferase family 2 protein [Rhizobium sp. Root1220]KQV70333.1 glycosyl transferase [Rhizobium sp. Root1220]
MISDPEWRGTGPRLAVVITCWNYERYVAHAIRSVTSQAHAGCELVVVDDGSTDASWDVIQREGVTAFHIDNGGSRAACLYGARRTRAPFVLFLDADDELEPGSIETIIDNLDDGVAKLQFPLTRIDGDGRVISGPVPKLDAFRDRRLAERVLRTGTYMAPPTSGNVFRRDLCELPAEVEYEQAIDGVMLFAAPFFGDVLSISKALGRYRVHDRNDSGVGRPLDAKLLRRELTRFVNRMDHLRRVLARVGKADDLIAAEQTYFFLERSFYLAIAEGRRVSAASLYRLIKQLWAAGHSVKARIALSAFLVTTAVLPNRRARKGLSYRLDAGDRSVTGLFRALL